MEKLSANLVSGSINPIPTNLSTITITSNSSTNIICTGSISGITTYPNSYTFYPEYPPVTYTYYPEYSPITEEEIRKRRKNELIDECEKDPELFNEVIVELRKRKIQKLKSKIN
jgi:predicted membrane-bound dolichyl-phosphate-mannose-protein mannosyltransferase